MKCLKPQGGVYIYDDELGNFSSDWYRFSESFLMDIDPANDSSDPESDNVAEFEWQQCQGNEISVLIKVKLTLNQNLTVTVDGMATLYETTNCSLSGKVDDHTLSGVAQRSEEGGLNWADRFDIENGWHGLFEWHRTDYTKI